MSTVALIAFPPRHDSSDDVPISQPATHIFTNAYCTEPWSLRGSNADKDYSTWLEQLDEIFRSPVLRTSSQGFRAPPTSTFRVSRGMSGKHSRPGQRDPVRQRMPPQYSAERDDPFLSAKYTEQVVLYYSRAFAPCPNSAILVTAERSNSPPWQVATALEPPALRTVAETACTGLATPALSTQLSAGGRSSMQLFFLVASCHGVTRLQRAMTIYD
ncbi:hypothetical protein EXIGLDRAFT_774385 [Exidia glandulosa HHB12029]|uniref:Uncharacterized protein n=1 Tax=Exidia glandulosa HHB12029 TaxID=1314781 RepID=A0A165EDK7_EXIGL|nr:hypothetical protein EXIGLDRAFT_774385 [Exidia glandulosa HHB12029]